MILKLKDLVAKLREESPNCIINIWASLECTNFSKAKGGMPRDADSRTLAEHLFRYIDAIDPDYIQIENVVEFMAWGPLGENGRPISNLSGTDYERWKENIKAIGYKYDRDTLNAADFAAYTSRKRYFGIFAKHHLPITFPEPTHSKKGEVLPKWNPVRDVLQLEEHGKSIFDRKKDLVDNTLKRIYAGINKHGHKSSGRFTTAYYGHGYNSSLDAPLGTIPTRDRFALVHFFSNSYNSGNNPGVNAVSIDQPCGTLTTVPKQNLVTVQYIYDTQFNNVGRHINQPCQTIIARQDKQPLYMMTCQYGEGFSIPVYDTDTVMMRWLKRHMVKHNIRDIKMRMLKVEELKVIQGFPKNYFLMGPQNEQKKFIGNSVCPIIPKVWIEAIHENQI